MSKTRIPSGFSSHPHFVTFSEKFPTIPKPLILWGFYAEIVGKLWETFAFFFLASAPRYFSPRRGVATFPSRFTTLPKTPLIHGSLSSFILPPFLSGAKDKLSVRSERNFPVPAPTLLATWACAPCPHLACAVLVSLLLLPVLPLVTSNHRLPLACAVCRSPPSVGSLPTRLLPASPPGPCFSVRSVPAAHFRRKLLPTSFFIALPRRKPPLRASYFLSRLSPLPFVLLAQ